MEDNCEPTSTFFEEQLQFLQENVPNWKNITCDDLTFQRMNGLTNITYKISIKDNVKTSIKPNAVLLRQFGANNKGLFSKTDERIIFKYLSDKGLGPKEYAENKFFRIEEFIQGRQVNEDEKQTREFKLLVLHKLATSFHNQIIPELSKENTLVASTLDDFQFMQKFFNKINQKGVYTEEEQRMLQSVKQIVSLEENKFLKAKMEPFLTSEKMVFCHNDVQEGNILIIEREDAPPESLKLLGNQGSFLGNAEIALIDYDYGSYNFRGYELGNFFNELCLDYTVEEHPFLKADFGLFPSEEEIEEYAEYYQFFFENQNIALEQAHNLIKNRKLLKQIIQEQDHQAFNERKQQLIKEIKLGALVSHYYWMIWAVIMAKAQDINQFDYIYYANIRAQFYAKMKNFLV